MLAYSMASKCSARKGANMGSDAMDPSPLCPPLPILLLLSLSIQASQDSHYALSQCLSHILSCSL